jgi:hypothetical protein
LKGFDIVALNYAVTLNFKIMTNTEQHETVLRMVTIQSWEAAKDRFLLITYSQQIHEVTVVIFTINFEGHKSKIKY